MKLFEAYDIPTVFCTITKAMHKTQIIIRNIGAYVLKRLLTSSMSIVGKFSTEYFSLRN